MKRATKTLLSAILACSALMLTVACGTPEEPPVDAYSVTVSATVEYGSVTVDKTEAAAGETVTVTVTPDEGYVLVADSLKANSTVIEENTFVMPEEDVIVTAQFEAITYSVTAQATTDDGAVSLSKTTAAAGETVEVRITASTGFEVGEVKVNGTAIEATDGNYTFTMPASDTAVEVSFVKTNYAITVEQNDYATVTTDAENGVANYGDVVTVTASDINVDYTLEGYTVNGTLISGNTFEMPAEAVTVGVQLIYTPVGETLGDSACGSVTYQQSGGFDVGTDKGDSAYVVQKDQGKDQQWVYFKNSVSGDFLLTANINVSYVHPEDGNPTTGLIVQNGNNSLYFFLQASELSNKTNVVTITGVVGGDWNWGSWNSMNCAEFAYAGENSVQLSIVKVEGTFFYFVNEAYVGMQSNINGFGANAECMVGFLSMATAGTYSDYVLSTNEADFAHMIPDGQNFGVVTVNNTTYGATGGWYFGEDRGENPSVSTDLPSALGEHVFFKQQAADFAFETKLNVARLNPADGNPTTGIIIKNGDGGIYFHVKVKDLNEGSQVRIMTSNHVLNYDYWWSGVLVGNAGKAYTGEGNYVTLGFVKSGTYQYFYLNGSLVYTAQYSQLGVTDNLMIGFVSMGVNALTYSDYTFTTDATAIANKIGAAAVTSVAAPAWTNGLASVGVTGSDNFAGKGVTFYAKTEENGVKVCAIATHSIYTADRGNWWENTNFELFSGGTQYFLTARCYGSDNMYGLRFYSVYDDTTKLYTTVAEAFIPAGNIAINDGVARLGFAWKTPGDVCNNGNDGESEYWLVPGRPANNGDRQFYVTSSGILESVS